MVCDIVSLRRWNPLLGGVEGVHPESLDICGPQIALALQLVQFHPQMSQVPKPNPPRNGFARLKKVYMWP